MEISLENDWQAWESWNSVHGTVFQSASFAETVKNSGMGVELVVAREGGSIVGGCFVFLPFPRFPLRFFGEYRIVNGPILVDYDEAYLFPILSFIEKRARIIGAMTLPIKFPQPDLDFTLEKKGYTVPRHAPSYSFIIDLTKSEKLLWEGLDKKTRTAIRKSQKNSVTIRQAHASEMRTVYSLYMQRAKAKKNWIPYPSSFFQASMGTRENNATLFVAEYQGKLIAEAMFLHYNKTIFYFNNGSLPAYWNLCANSQLVWEGMLLGKKLGCKNMDLYGTTDGRNKDDLNYSLYQFKASFGGTLVHTNTFASQCLAPIRKKVWDILVPIVLPFYKVWSESCSGGGFDEYTTR